MKSYTKEELEKKFCPFQATTDGCCTTRCMACHEKHSRVSREDHSGGSEAMLAEAIRRGRSFSDVKREGPGGCLGKFTLEAEYVCLRLEEQAITLKEPVRPNTGPR
jgi:hypothetical protein